MFADGEIDKDGYELLRDKARADLDAATAEMERLGQPAPALVLPSLEALLQADGGWATMLGSGEMAAQRDVLATLVDRVVPVRGKRGQYQATITWTPLGESLRTMVAAPAEAVA